jgi:hypothetical protein
MSLLLPPVVRRRGPLLQGALLLGPLLLLGCGDSEKTADSAAVPCVSFRGVVTDIDETLTTTDGEWLSQLADPTHDPAMRPEANALMQAYADQGYGIFYVTARGEDAQLADGRSAREATRDWLVDHDFPVDEDRLYLADGIGALGDSAVAYKSGVIDDLGTDGWSFDWAYGNADTDILAFQASEIPNDTIFLVGELAGTMGVEPIVDGDAYAAHRAVQEPRIIATDCAGEGG